MFLWKLLAVSLATTAGTAFAAEGSAIDTGDTAWVLISTALVLVMTPGLAFFYGGMVRTKNVVSTLFQNFAVLGVIGILWGVVGYSLAFSTEGSAWLGGLNWLFLQGVGQEPFPEYAATIPHLSFMMFQGMFAIITPALITGAVAERLNFKPWILIAALWSLVVYAPVAHWVWSLDGWIRKLGALDFAGGLVVHITAGFSALVAAVMLGKRVDFGEETHPYDASFVMIGTALLWFGWFGFNAGSALAANGLAAHAFATTFFGAASAALAWVLVDIFLKGKPSAVGACIGAVVGLVTITPASGFVPVWSSFLIGAFAGVVCNLTAVWVKEKLKLDDTLDVFACHGLGGLIGAILTGVFASKAVNPAGGDGLIYGGFEILKANVIASLVTIAYSMACTYVLIKVIGKFVSIRVPEHAEESGLDQAVHGEVINSAVVKPVKAAASSTKPKSKRRA